MFHERPNGYHIWFISWNWWDQIHVHSVEHISFLVIKIHCIFISRQKSQCIFILSHKLPFGLRRNWVRGCFQFKMIHHNFLTNVVVSPSYTKIRKVCVCVCVCLYIKSRARAKLKHKYPQIQIHSAIYIWIVHISVN